SVTLGSGEDKTGVDLELGLGEITGTVKDEDGNPISGATVEVYDENDDLVGTETTSGSGKFRVEDLPLGTYTIVITADGYKTVTLENEELDDDELNVGTVTASKEAEPLDIGAYWWLILLIIIIVVVIIIVALLAKRKKPEPEAVPPGTYAEAQVQQPPYEAPPEAPSEAPPEGWPQPPETGPEQPPPGTPPEGPPPE
ncbi:MAG: carboxypeptidase regulatory-like domain-containing protein, partial [Thermoplasmata archaeon]|nr:carboxypeptidase regulatory-like domain-containing protein [Thermoplasmata archaeon]